MRLIIVAWALLIAGDPSSRAATATGDQIVGEWRGSSVCVNRKLAPACRDETVRYVFTPKDGAANTYHLVADKLVAGSYQTMGEFDVVYSAADSTWSYVFNAPNCAKCRWWYRIDSPGLIGGLANITGDALRRVEVRRNVP